MGSLMAGWDSHVQDQDPNLVKFSRNKSLTKEEIDAFWKLKKLKEEEHLRDISLLSPRTKKIIFEGAAKLRSEEDSTDTDPLDTAEKELLRSSSLEKLLQKHGWWTSSNSAFLNEPPVLAPQGTADRYVSQFHVAKVAGSTESYPVQPSSVSESEQKAS